MADDRGFIRLSPNAIEPRGDHPPEWDELTAELPEEWEPEPDEPDDLYLPDDYHY